MTPAQRMAAEIADIRRRLTAMERASQLGSSSVDVNGTPVLISDGLAAGLAAEIAAADALDAATSAEAKADGKVQTFYGVDEPVDASVGDFWVDNAGHVFIYNGTEWRPVDSTAVADALTAAQNAEAAVDGKITTFYGPSGTVPEVAAIPGTPAESTASVTSITATLPPGLVDGDYVFLFAALNASSGVITAPAGYTELFPSANSVGPSTSLATAIYYKRWQSGDINPVVTCSNGRIGVLPVRVTGLPATSPVDGTPATNSGSVATNDVVAPSITPSTSIALFTWFAGRSQLNGDYILWTTPTGMTAVGMAGGRSTTTNATGALFTQTVPAGTATGTRTSTASITTYGSRAVSFALQAAAPYGEPVAEAVGDLWFVTDDDNRLRRWDGLAWVDARDAGIVQAISTAEGAADTAATAQGAAEAAQGTATAAQSAAAAAASAASLAQSTADGRNRIFRVASTAPPTGPFVEGDLWFVTDEDNRAQRWDGSAWVAFGLGTQAISNLDVGKLTTGELSAGQRIIAGPEAGTHAEMSDTGFRVFAEDDLDGIPNEVIRLGTDTDDYFGITDSTGDLVGSVSADGFASFAGLSADDDPTFGGQTLTEIVSASALGVIGYAQRTTAGDDANTTTYQPFLELQVDVKAGRLYRISTTPIWVSNSVANVAITTQLRIAYDGDPVSTSSSTIQQSRIQVLGANTGYVVPPMIKHYSPGTDREIRVLVTYITSGGVGRIAPSASQPLEMTVEDIGPYRGDVGIERTGASLPAVPTKKTYTSTWTSNGSETYRGDGSARTDTTDVVQGYNSANGNGKGLWTFSGGATSGETGKTLSAAMNGSTVTKVEIYAYASHWYYNSGGTARIALHGYTTPPASSPGLTYTMQSTGWPKPGGRWVTLPSSTYAAFAAYSWKGFGMGPGPSNDLLYYGRFKGTGAKLRITYTR